MRQKLNTSAILSDLLLAGVYFLFGLAGLQLAIAPGYASAIFPAAGIGFAAIQSISTEPKKTRDYDEMKLYSSSYFS
ncbi:MAG: hypothetical protein QX198_15955 [Methylococcaceae bacterium]